MSLRIRKMQDDISYGVRIAGVTSDLLDDPLVHQQINDAFEKDGMIIFEDVDSSTEMQLKVSNVFGPLKQHPARSRSQSGKDKEVMLGLSEIASSPSACIVEVDGQPRINWQPWHFDHCYNDELNRGGVLRSVTTPPEGGETLFCDGIQIYKNMSPRLRAKIEDLNIIYKLDLRMPYQKYGMPENFRQLRDPENDMENTGKLFPRALHPAVWTRRTGEKVVHIGPYMAKGIEGMENAEGDALFNEVWDEILRTMEVYTHYWEPTDMVIWDNWRMLHQAAGCDPKYHRVVRRTTIKGDYGLGRFENGAKIGDPLPEMM